MTGKEGMKYLHKRKEICECGLEIGGLSEKHLTYNLKKHKKQSKVHLEIMRNRKK